MDGTRTLARVSTKSELTVRRRLQLRHNSVRDVYPDGAVCDGALVPLIRRCVYMYVCTHVIVHVW